jgi:PAS domain S-box-containing protein
VGDVSTPDAHPGGTGQTGPADLSQAVGGPRERSFFDVALDCLVMADGSGRIVEFNPSAESVFGYSRDDALGRTLSELIVPPSLRDAHNRAFDRFVSSGEMRIFGQRIELTAMRSDGTEFPVELALSQVEGEPLLVCGSVRDLTAAKQTEADLHHLAEEQRALRRVATLVARGSALQEVFDAACSETGRLVDARQVSVVRYEPDGPPPTVFLWHTDRSDSTTFSDGTRSETTVTITADGVDWGVIVVEADHPLSAPAPASVAGLAELIAIAISNAKGRAELLASRTRILTAADEARRRLQRDIHDGAQQRLVTSLIHLQLAEERMDTDPDAARRGVRAALESSRQGLNELRDLAAGLHPSILTSGGLGAALDGLASRSLIPVSIDAPDARYPGEVEVAAYFFVGEALANIGKYASASHVEVVVEEDAGGLALIVSDDGIGGARLDGGSGLRGLQDRMTALGGSFRVESPAGQGTVLRALLPLTTDK